MAFIPNRPLVMVGPSPTKSTINSEEELCAILPRSDLSTTLAKVVNLLSLYSVDERYLLSNDNLKYLRVSDIKA